ncbi:hypothetical protein NPIL_219191 [Nephila pilipes]|uniref:DUF4817 domain-containing protein n=1 Tax=Nephila pilipes TaxID=299642 RepID=A0A8X6QDL7_NEPPI|nr:hypothetical protein NPIL_219191 [Nephila pilipes]
MSTIKEKIAVVSARLQGMSHKQVREDFVRKFKKPDPSRQAIRDIVNKFQRSGNFADENRSGKLYLEILLHQQLETDGIKRAIVFQLYGAPTHLVIIVRDYLNERFPNRWIGHGFRRL